MTRNNDEFIMLPTNEAYSTLEEISADEQKRIEYEAREKALKDYNTQMLSAENRGLKRGTEKGKEQINQLNKLLSEQNRVEDIIRAAKDKEYQEMLIEEFGL